MLARLYLFVPTWRALLTVVLSSSLGAAIAFGLLRPAGSAPAHDYRFVAIGKTYHARLGVVYASAWDEGVKHLEAGDGVGTAIEAVAKAWSSNRTALYDEMLTPAFSKIVAESVKDADVTPQERAALVSAWRGLAIGLRK